MLSKDQIRTAALRRRDLLAEAERTELSRIITEFICRSTPWREARIVMSYMSIGSEVNTSLFNKMTLEAGKRLALPKVDLSSREMSIYIVTDLDNDLLEGCWKIKEPRPDRCPPVALEKVDFSLIPGVAFDLTGGRIGYGGGFYDRFLASRRKKGAAYLAVGASFTLQIVAKIPQTQHDQPLDALVTEKGWQNCVLEREPKKKWRRPMIRASEIAGLKAKVGAENVYTELEDLHVLGYDSTPELHALPEVVIFPRRIEDIQVALGFAADLGLAVTPRGSGTGLSGGSVPVAGGMVMCLTRMNKILEIDEENLTATAEAGAITIDLFKAAAAKGLFYPPDPGSQMISTLGGNVAENAGGLRGLKYGVTRNYVMALSGVLGDGTIFRTGGKCVKDVAGYSVRDLMVGSEGTLGIITEVTVRLIPPPQTKRTLLAYFRDIRTAGEAVSRIIAARIIPATLEIMDHTTINCVEDYAKIGLPREMAALLLIEVDGHPAVVEEEAIGVKQVLEAVKADEIHQATTTEEAGKLSAARRSALSAVARVSPSTILEDATVPRNKLAETFAEIEKLKKKLGIRVATFGHAGDGNLHPTALADERNRDEITRVYTFFDELYEKVLALGGTVSGEHGIGIAKKEYLRRQIGEGGMGVMRRLKRSFDPKGILNPEKLTTS